MPALKNDPASHLLPVKTTMVSKTPGEWGLVELSPKDRIMANGGCISMGRAGLLLETSPDSAVHPRKEMDGRQGHKVFYEQLQRVIYVPSEGRVKGYNLKIEVSFL